MKKIIRGLVKRVFGKKTVSLVKQNFDFYQIGTESIFSFNNLVIRDKSFSRIFLEIGDKCVIEGDFIFENSKGYIKIGDRTYIGGSTKFICTNRIEVGSDVMFSWGCTVIDSNSHSTKWEERMNDVADWKRGIDEDKIGAYKNWEVVRSAPIHIKDKAWIGFNVIIMKGITIGEGAIVGSGSVVTKDVPDFAIVAGNPAQIIKYTT